MAFEKQSGKVSGRTPEQQAARDARKAAKKAAEVAAERAPSESKEEVDADVDGTSPKEEAEAESSTAATRKRKHNTDIDELEVDLEAPTPMNKKEARLAKKKKARGDDPAEGEGEGEKKEKVVKPVVEKRNSVWIGNLSFRTQGDRIKEWLETGVKELGGDEGCVTRVNLPKEKNKGEFGPSKGFAFVDFSSPENQKLAVDLSERLLEGRKLLIKLGNDHTANPEARTPKPVKPKGLEKQPHGESATLFVGNLPFDATEEGLRDMIENSARSKGPLPKVEAELDSESDSGSDGEDEGEDVEKKAKTAGQTEKKERGGKASGLRKVRLGAFEDTGRCKGFAFLDFLTPAEATAALINKGNRFYTNRKLILQYASQDATKRSGTGRAMGTGVGLDDSRPPRPKFGDSKGPRKDGGGDKGESGGDKDTRGKKWEAAGRTAPGAALAAAKREKVGIVEGTGSKIVFD